MAAPQQISVFVSYSHRDRAWREQIAESLQQADLEVLDDTRLLSGQNWEEELRKLWERARVAVLIVTQNFLASDTIQSGELPRLLDLQRGNRLHLMPVIAEPCNWQELSAIRDIQAFPQFGRPLASDPGNIAKQLDELAQQIVRLVTGDTANAPTEPRTPSQPRRSSSSRSTPPSNQAPLSEPRTPSPSNSSPDSLAAPELALRLFVKSTGYAAMASLVSPTLAVTPYHVLRQAGLLENRDLPITIEGSPRARISTTASVIAASESANVALLRLRAGVYTSLIGPEVPPTTILPAGRWQSYCMPTDAKGWMAVGGQIGGSRKLENHEYQTLGLDPRIPGGVGGVSGAPVIWNEQLIGIVALASQDGSSWYATLITQQLIDELANSSSIHHKPSGWLTKEDIESFSPEVREIINRADQLRLQRKLRAVTIASLLRSLAQQEGGQLAKLLEAAQVDLELAFQADNRRFPIEALVESGFPPISPNVRWALLMARDEARKLGSKTIDESHLLFGTLAVPDHPAIEALKARGITSDKIKFDTAPPQAQKSDLLAGVQSDTPGGDDLLDITPEVNALASVLAAKDADPPLALGLFGEWGSGKSFFMGRLESRIRALQDDAQKARKEGAQSSYCEHIVQLTFNAWNYIDTNLWASLATEIFEGLASAVAKRRGTDSQAERALVLAAASSSQEVLAETERKKSAAEEELKQTQQQLTILQNSQGNIETRLSPAELFKQAYRFAIAQDEVKKHVDGAAQELQVREGMSAVADIKAEILELRGFWTTLRFTLRHGNLWVWFLVFGVVLGAACGIHALLQRFQIQISGAAKHVVAILTAVSGFLGMFRVWARKALKFIKDAQESKQKLIEEKKQQETEALEKQYKEVQERVQQATVAVDSAKQTVDKINKQLENMRADRQMADYIRQRNESTDYTQHLGIIARVRTDFRHLSILLQDVRAESEKDFLKLKQRQKEMEAERQQAKEAERLKEAQEKKAEGIPEETAPQSVTAKARSQMEDIPADKEDKLFPRIDRIILYIDDLDRCPEKNVVEVLQAVHLLLAFPLFIVVVGVDPRWLLRSLERHSAVFSNEPEQNGGNRELDEDPLWESTPMNYLEKIFQIPFTLRPINSTGFGKLVDKFAAARKKEKEEERFPASTLTTGDNEKKKVGAEFPAEMAAGAAAASGSAGQSMHVPAGQTANVPAQTENQPPAVVQQPSNIVPDQRTAAVDAPAGRALVETVIDRNPEHLQIEKWERDFMKTLHELIPSPRAGKRFINIYRLIRASVKDTERKNFIGNNKSGEYQPVQMLLAILIGYPAEATEILQRLIEHDHPETWGEFITALKESFSKKVVETAKSQSSAKRQTQDKGAKGTQATLEDSRLRLQRWNELFEKLDPLTENLKDTRCAVFCDWAPETARYSFQSGRVMLYQRE